MSAQSAKSVNELFEAVCHQNKRAIARSISILHDNRPQRRALLARLHHTHRIGITGGGAHGKSTLISALSRHWGAREHKLVGVIGIDPSDRATAGAHLGDRTRMQDNFLEPWFYMRSLATRGNPHGIVERLNEILLVFDAARYDIALVETIGASQDDIAIWDFVDTLVVVMAPIGDSITYQKAGLMDMADIFAVNYGDMRASNRAMDDLRSALKLQKRLDGWKPLVVKTTALTAEGIPELIAAIEKHRNYLLEKKTP